ncbi:MAG: nicotinate phosphoribosyltransferase [Actinobacteria bacterium]|nr:nicotinate phosphoribosyltransferase [Actinomycetota bacterium]
MDKFFFHTAGSKEIKEGGVTDVYFLNDVEILKSLSVDKKVRGEVRAATLPDDWKWAVLAGVEEALHLLEGVDVDVFSMEEGTIVEPEVPVLAVEGKYTEWAIFETSLLGFLCQASGTATRAARCKIAAGPRGVYSFGARRMHPAITPMIERAAFIGGCDGVATTIAAELIGEKPVGTMPHALIITIGDEREAFKAYDRIIDPDVKRVALVDTFNDEKFGALIAADALKERLEAVRLDTPRSRRGNFFKIAQEVRWELDLRGYKDVRIFASGGIDESAIAELNPLVDAYGVGGYISNAPIVDFSLDLVEVDGKPVAKRGKMSGAKQVWRCPECRGTLVLPADGKPPECCGARPAPLISKTLSKGRVRAEFKKPRDIRAKVLEQLKDFER